MLLQHGLRRLQQEARRLLRPAGKRPAAHGGIHAQIAVHQVVGLAQKLHFPVFDAVMDHLDEMSGAAAAHPAAAGFPDVRSRADLKQKRHHQILCRLAASGHQGRTVQSALFAAGNAAAHVQKPLFFHGLCPLLRILVIGIAAVDHDVARFQIRGQLRKYLVHRIPRLYHQQDFSGNFQLAAELLQAVRSAEIALPILFKKRSETLLAAVVYAYRKAFALQVAGDAAPHYTKAYHGDIRSLFHASFPLIRLYVSARFSCCTSLARNLQSLKTACMINDVMPIANRVPHP